jgi:hypothetical protein
MWYVGQKVICIREGWTAPRNPQERQHPKYHQILTIRTIDPSSIDIGKVCFRFEEIINDPACYRQGFLECTFREKYFRPLVERKTIIEVFEKLLVPSKTMESV